FLAQASAVLDSLASICNTSVDSHAAALDGLALELSIGRTPTDLLQYSCQYVVTGLVSSDASPIVGVYLDVSAPGLTTCTTISSVTGSYQCVLTPDLDSIIAEPATFPLPVTVAAHLTADGPAVATVGGEFAAKAAVGTRGSVIVDVDVDAALLPNIDVFGTAFAKGDPAPPFYMELVGRNASGSTTATVNVKVTPNPVTAEYSVHRVFPAGTVSVKATALIGVIAADRVDATAPSLGNGPNDLPFDIDYDPPVVVLTGTMTGVGGAPLAGTVPVTVTAYHDSQWLGSWTATAEPTGPNGAYSTAPMTLPVATNQITAFAPIAVVQADYPTLTDHPVHTGSQTVTFDVAYSPPTLAISGSMLRTGAPPNALAGARVLQARAYDASDVVVFNQAVPVTVASDGAYSVVQSLPETAVRAEVYAIVGLTPADYASTTVPVPTLLANALTPVGLDVTYNPPVLTVAGALKDQGGNPLGNTFVNVDAFAGATLLQSRQHLVSPGAGGAYTLTVDLPLTTDNVSVTAKVGVVPGDWVSVNASDLHAGTNPTVPLDVTYGPPVARVSGTLTNGAGNPLGATTIQVIAYNDNSPLFSATRTVTPAGGGSYTVDVDLPTSGWTRVVAIARIGSFTSDYVTSSDADFGTGVIAVPLSAVYHPPIASFTGTLTGALGEPVTSTRVITVRAYDAADTILGQTTTAAIPNNMGVYPAALATLPRLATRITASVNPGTTSYDVVTEPYAVVPGTNQLVLDAALNVPRLHLYGELTRDGAPLTSYINMYMAALDNNGNYLSYYQYFNGFQSDTGSYDYFRTMPTGTVRVQGRIALVELGGFASDDILFDYPVSNGLNEFEIPIVQLSRSFHLEGTVTRNGVPLANTTFPTYTWHKLNNTGTYSADARTIWITTDAVGHYVIDAALPMTATGIEMQYRVPSAFLGEGEIIVENTIDGFHAGGNTIDDFDVVATERVLTITGELSSDGV
ncbi:MAG TPA: hypothetical protein PLV68_04560, partial [Ilumatobacteraceae bacterium]|nr:hypothetical protein [Ilumatobacteraceae bacterium]